MSKKKVYCKGCAFLMLVKDMPPLCLAKADLKGTPIRSDGDVMGIAEAHKRNRRNDCDLRSRFSNRRVRRVKSRMLETVSELSLDAVSYRVGTKEEPVVRPSE